MDNRASADGAASGDEPVGVESEPLSEVVSYDLATNRPSKAKHVFNFMTRPSGIMLPKLQTPLPSQVEFSPQH